MDTNQLTNQPTIKLSEFEYPSYDKVGNRLDMIKDSVDIHTYTYDNTYQLIQTIDHRPIKATQYDYDVVGNRDIVTEDGSPVAYVSNEMNEYESVGGVAYSYDANGNLTSDGINTYEYDFENRLITVHCSLSTVNFGYDAFGRRVSKKIYDSLYSLLSILYFTYDGDQVIAEYNGDTGELLAKYTYGPGIDEPIRMERGGASYYYHFDGLGSVTGITDSSGAVVESYSYDVYGNPSITSSVGNRYLFTGREYDQETGLYYYRARYYSPTIGRFLQRDPIGYRLGMNLYSYCNNSPVNWIDPWGLDKEKPWYEDFEDWFMPSVYAETDDPSPKEPVLGQTEGSSFGWGDVGEVLIGGGIGLVGVGFRLGSLPLIGVGLGIAIVGAGMALYDYYTVPERAKETAERMYEQTGIEEQMKDLEEAEEAFGGL